jgi:hypothetical protein
MGHALWAHNDLLIYSMRFYDKEDDSRCPFMAEMKQAMLLFRLNKKQKRRI